MNGDIHSIATRNNFIAATSACTRDVEVLDALEYLGAVDWPTAMWCVIEPFELSSRWDLDRERSHAAGQLKCASFG